MPRKADPEKEQFWKTHILQSKAFDGSVIKYCESQGIAIHKFKYWKYELEKRSSVKSTKPSPFLPVQIKEPETKPRNSLKTSDLPDARWVAEVITHLIRGF